jgi:hypothetical protein
MYQVKRFIRTRSRKKNGRHVDLIDDGHHNLLNYHSNKEIIYTK